MAFDLYLMGHGCYRQKNGIVVLPENFVVKFYSEHGNGLPESKIQPILRGEEEAKQTFADQRQNETVGCSICSVLQNIGRKKSIR